MGLSGAIKNLLPRWKEVLLITFIVRAGLLIFSFVFNLSSAGTPYHLWIHWDSSRLIEIAKIGYPTHGDEVIHILWYPLFPFLIKMLSLFIGNFELSAILLSIFFSFTAAILLFELASLDFKKEVAIKAVWFLNIFPTAYFLQAGYSESLFLTLTMASFYFIRKGNYLEAGLSGVFATMIRVNGLILIPTLPLEGKSLKKSLFVMFITPLGFFYYLLLNFVIFKDPFFFKRYYRWHLFQWLEWPWKGIQNLILTIPNSKESYAYFQLASLIFVLVAGILIFIKLRKSYGLYVLLNFLFYTSNNLIASAPRYALFLFPIFILLGKIRNKIIFSLLSVAFMAPLFYYTLLFTRNEWAF